jgi:lipoprotein signal peptidase
MNSYKLLLIFHTFIVGPLFIYIGIKKEKINLKIYDLLYYLSIPLLLYHMYKAYTKIVHRVPWVNYIHIFLIVPLLYYMGKNKNLSPNYYYELLLLLGFGVLGHNGYKLLTLN